MQAQEILRNLRLPEFEDFSQFFRSLPAATLVGIGAFAAVVAYWLASRPKAVKPPCDLLMQSEEVEVSLYALYKEQELDFMKSCCCVFAALFSLVGSMALTSLIFYNIHRQQS